MRFSLKSLLIVVLIAVLAVTAIGAANTQIQASLAADITIRHNGEVQSFRDANGNPVYPIMYQGTTYLPLRAVSGMLGVPVEWEGATRTVWLGARTAPSGWTKANPAPVGIAVIVDYKLNSSPNSSWKGTMVVTQVLRGTEAAAQFNQTFIGQNKVGDNQELVLARIQITNAADSPSQWRVGLTQFFTGYSGNGDRLSGAFYGVPKDGEGYVWRGFVVDKADTQPKLAFETVSVKNVWFGLY